MPRTLLRTLTACLALAGLASVFALPARADEVGGRQLLNALGCKGCHSFEGSGGSIGPALDGVGKRLAAEEIRLRLMSPQAHNPQSMMPSYSHLPKADLDTLVGFLAERK